MARTLIPHPRDNEPVIDCFYCSSCTWSRPLLQLVPYELPYNEVALVCCEFERHRCEDFDKRTEVA